MEEPQYIFEGLGLEVAVDVNGEIGFSASIRDGGWEICTPEEAIAAAKAILGHYGVSYQVGQEAW